MYCSTVSTFTTYQGSNLVFLNRISILRGLRIYSICPLSVLQYWRFSTQTFRYYAGKTTFWKWYLGSNQASIPLFGYFHKVVYIIGFAITLFVCNILLRSRDVRVRPNWLSTRCYNAGSYKLGYFIFWWDLLEAFKTGNWRYRSCFLYRRWHFCIQDYARGAW